MKGTGSRWPKKDGGRKLDWQARWVLRCLEAILPDEWRDPLIGDLLEEWSTEIVPNVGRARGQSWLLGQAIMSSVSSVLAHIRKVSLMTRILFVVALLLGGFSALVDSLPTWDDTGVLAFGILISCALLGSFGPARPWRWALAVGSWIPLHDIISNRGYTSLLALGFAFAGAYVGATIRRTLMPLPPANNSDVVLS